MADKKDIYSEHGLGDITTLMHNQGVSDLSWLAVDELDYRASEALPKQNLDIIPELQKALSSDSKDDDVPQLIPLRPHTIVNRNPLSNEYMQTSETDQTAPIRNRVARLVMAGLPPAEIEKRIRLEFAPGDIRLASDSIREVMNERGVLGNVYIDARHFPNAHRDPKERKYATTFGKGAIFVIGGCGGKNGCNCHETGMCATFGNKRVVDEVPYGVSVASHYASRLASEKRPIPSPGLGSDKLPVSSREWKECIRSAFLKAPIVHRDGGVKTVQTQHVPAKPQVTKQDVASFIAKNSATKTREEGPSSAWFKYARRMTHGSDDRSVLVASTDPELRSLASEYGILGHTYLDMDTLGGCRNTVALMDERGLSPDFVIRRSSSCPICSNTSDGACAEICRRTVMTASKPEIGKAAFVSAMERAVSQGRIAADQASVALSAVTDNSVWSKLTSQANLYASSDDGPSEYSGIKLSAHHGDPGRSDSNVTTQMNPEEVRRTLSHLMNLGLSGRALQGALLKRYSVEDLRQVPDVGRRASADDGVQGYYFIDPTAYTDYGKGCSEGSKHFRKQGAAHVLASKNCTGCTLQTAPGWCSKYAKGLIRQVPTQVREHIASARKLPVIQREPVENPVEKYELSSELSVDLNGSKSREISVSIPSGSLGD
jgi:hypothetical protein